MTADYAQAVRDQQAWVAIENGDIAGFAILICSRHERAFPRMAAMYEYSGWAAGAIQVAHGTLARPARCAVVPGPRQSHGNVVS